jgi:hypothetical protein
MISRNVSNDAFTHDRDLSLGIPQPEIGKERSQQDKIAKVREANAEDGRGLSAGET